MAGFCAGSVVVEARAFLATTLLGAQTLTVSTARLIMGIKGQTFFYCHFSFLLW
jgi:hypothetical protein